MSRSYHLDASAATWLAHLDPALSLLPGALPPATATAQWLLHDVRWTTGDGCRLAYQVHRPGTTSTFVAVDLTGEGCSRYDYRDDAALPGLVSAADPALVADRLGSLAGEPLRSCHVEPVRYRPGARCVLRYDVATASTRTVLYAKVLRPDTFAETSARSGVLAAAPDVAGLVPETVAVWPDLHVLVGRGVAGRTVSAVLGDAGVPATERARLAHRLGELLARFHSQTGVTVPPWSAEDQVAALAGSLAAAQCADARLGRRLGAVVDALGGALPSSDTPVLTHGAFRPGQVVVAGDGHLVVLDTDGVCRSDPGRDLGTALAHLFWLGVRQPQDRQMLRGAERALLSGYRSRGGAVDAQALRWWHTAALLQVAVRRYRRLELSAWPLVHVLADAAEALLLEDHAHDFPGGATDLLDPAQMSALLRPALASVATSPQALQVDTADELASASGRRSVVRYTVRGLDGVEPARVVGKVFTESRRARLLHQHLESLHAGPFRDGPLRVPEPLALLPEQRLVLYRSFDGVRLDRLADGAPTEDGVRLAARWLARLHSSDVCLPRRFSLDQESESTRQWAALVGHVHPPVAAQAQWLAERWVQAVRSADAGSGVPVHKDFHAGHVLVGDGVCVIDLDEARLGDPAFDLAHFGAYLELCAGADAGALSRCFLDEYVAATAWVDKGTYGAFRAYSWLKIAKQWAAGSGPCQEGSPARRRAGVEDALARAETCLSE